MLKAELFQTAAQITGQAKELFDAGVRANLLQSLVEQGHPYGLLFGNTQASGLPVFCSEISLLSSSGKDAKLREKGPKSTPEELNNWSIYFYLINPTLVKSATKWASKDRSSGSSYNDPSSKSPSSFENIFLNTLLSLRKSPDTRRKISSALKTGSAVAIKWDQSRQAGLIEKAAIAPMFLRASAGEMLLERSRELTVGKHSVSLGTTAIKLATYHGEQPFVVRTPQGEPVAQINPGDQLGHLHVSHQASFMRGLSVIEKTRQITGDFIDLLKIITTGEANLKTGQQDVLAKAQNATLIGISHLVPLFRLKTGLPTWKLDVLPELIQRFHQHDSQAVSTAFGGTRKVRVNDIEMMVVTPQMRQQLAAAYA